jgi:hypothetical protein
MVAGLQPPPPPPPKLFTYLPIILLSSKLDDFPDLQVILLLL